jgi:cyclopropane-fatty-acyl-phospholipid synthase
MDSSTTASSPALARPVPAAGRTVQALLARLRHGTLTVRWPDGSEQHYGQGAPRASLHVTDWQACGAALRSGDVGFAESYLAGDWQTPCLPSLLALLVANRAELDRVVYGTRLGRWAARLRHLLNRNTRRGSRRNIHAHYDLGNAFYRLWLDPSMNYSSALFEAGHDGSLELAQAAKVRRALAATGVQAGDRVLEIGCGWGALAECAVREFGAHVTGVTLSTEQLAYAQERLQPLAGRADVDLRLQDYRDIDDGPYDAVCSIEMVEAVGQAYWPTYFATVARLLKPGGRACIQTIRIADELWERYRDGTDFIQQYVFPGGCLPSPRGFEAAAAAAGLRVVDTLAFGPDYAETLRRWRRQFDQQRQAVTRLGFDERFLRLWEFYLCYCEAAFDAGDVDVAQYTLERVR